MEKSGYGTFKHMITLLMVKLIKIETNEPANIIYLAAFELVALDAPMVVVLFAMLRSAFS